MMAEQINLSGGTWEYEDRGDGPTIVLLQGVMMNASIWAGVVDRLERHFRCVVPTLPLGGHRLPLSVGVDRSPVGVADMLAEFLERLDLSEVTLVGSDTGGALAQILVTRQPERVGRLVLVSCDAFENFPPGLPGRISATAAATPGGLLMAAQSMRFRPVSRLPITWGCQERRVSRDARLLVCSATA